MNRHDYAAHVALVETARSNRTNLQPVAHSARPINREGFSMSRFLVIVAGRAFVVLADSTRTAKRFTCCSVCRMRRVPRGVVCERVGGAA